MIELDPETLQPKTDGWWWLSFCDPDLPTGKQFLGAAIVPGGDMISAASAAHVLGCNPGGEVLGLEIPREALPHLADKWRKRLLSREECEVMDAEILASKRASEN